MKHIWLRASDVLNFAYRTMENNMLPGMKITKIDI